MSICLQWIRRAVVILASLPGSVALGGCNNAQAQVSDVSYLTDLVAGVINSSDPGIRSDLARRVAWALLLGQREVDSLPDQLIDDVASLLSDDRDSTKRFAAEALRSMGGRAKRALPALERALERTPDDSRPYGVDRKDGAFHAIRSALHAIAPETVTPYLTKLIADVVGGSDRMKQVLAADDIYITVLLLRQSEIDTLPDQVIDEIATLLELDPTVQSFAATALRFMGSRARRALPDLERALRRNRASNATPPGTFDAVGQAILGIMGGEPYLSPAIRRN